MLAPALVLCLASGNGRAVGGLILTFHRVGVHKVDVLSWVTYAPSTTDLLRVIASLHDTGFTFVTVSELLAAVAAEPDDQLRPALAAITFDDGDASVARAALPALLSVGVRATVFVVTERLGLPGSLTREELLDLKAAGWEVGSHSASHPYLPDLTAEAMRRELDVAAITLEDLIGPGPRCFAYPFGGHDARVRSMVAQFHACAVTTAPGLAASRMELLAMPRPSSSGLDGRGVGWRAGRGLDPLSLIVSGALMGGLWPGVPGGAASPPLRWQPATWRGLGYGSYEIGYREGAISETLGLRDGRWSLQAWRSRALTPAAGSGAALAAARSFGDLTVAAAWVTGERWGVGLALDLDEQGEAWAWWTAGGGWRFGLEALLADAVRLSTSWRSADDRFTAELWAALPWWPEEGRPLSVALGVDQALYARLAGRVGSHELALSADAHGRMAASLRLRW